jgi:hypothetical protein
MRQGTGSSTQESSEEHHSLLLSPAIICGYPTVGFFAHIVGADAWFVRLSPLFIIVTLGALLRDVAGSRKKWGASWSRTALTLGILATALSAFVWIFSPTDLIPAYDSIVVPTYARLFIKYGSLTPPLDVEGRVAFLYPPGFSMLLLGPFKVMNPVDVLVLFKWLCVGAVAMTPFSWALLCRVGFGLHKVPFWILCAAVYVGFLLFDRSILFGLVIAGKNSQLLQSFLIPFFFMQLMRARGAASILAASVCGCGLFLVHFSGLYMTALFLVSYTVTGFLFGARWRDRYRQWLAFLGSLLLFSPQALSLADNAAFLSPATAQSVDGPSALWGIFADKYNKFVFIFNEAGLTWPYKGGSVAVLVLLVLTTMLVRKAFSVDRNNLPADGKGFICLLGAWLGAVLLAYRVVPIPGINLDYSRWFAYNFLASAVGVGFLIVFRSVVVWRTGAVAAVAAVLVSVVWVLWPDLQWARQRIGSQAFVRSELRPVVNLLPREGRCTIITSNSGPGPVVLQSYRPFEYISALTPCEVMSGSFGTYNSYLLDPSGRPTFDYVERALRDTRVLYLGAVSDAERFFSALPQGKVAIDRLKSFKGFSVWSLSFREGDIPTTGEMISEAVRASPS